ncbi:uncharacterized protein LOC122869825 isoform X2 [Siniperca chuatsi]|uniref:uncharacterized protein LOC122869825 isoform X2 n=1 Tax=Siniperca chuatsi TaxID=119488 RepID=UPI001CE0AE32|nr:uncharacterized protein LOC122869825 isoform X2 [Siniperca chuatsi]
MMNFTLITALILCSLSWISVSASESQTVNVQPGAEATLLCSKTSESESLALWFRVVNRTKASSISTMTRSASKPLYLDGFKNGIFEMGSNTSTVSLKIKRVNFSDSGLYFCGFNAEGWTILSVIHLNVEGSDESHEDVDRKSKKCDRITMLMSVILGGLTVFLLMVIVGLVVKNRKLQTAASEEQKPQQRENLGTDELNYAAVNFCPKGRRREVEPNVVYSATR